MDIRKSLLEEHSKAQCEKIVRYIGSDPAKFAELMKAFFGPDYKVTQRAAWPISYCVRSHPSLIEPYFEKMIALLEKPGIHNAVTRNITRLLQEVTIPRKFHGKLMTACFDFVSTPATSVAVKAFALTILYNLSRYYPEILPELKLVIAERFENESPAFKSRSRRILRKLK